jgi:predicted DsbA family dithiol-disulfide isomerase
MVEVAPGTIVVYSDVGCPWAHLCVYRLHRARSTAGLDNDVHFDMRAFPLEVFNEQPTPKNVLDAEISVAGALDPGAGWQMWQGQDHEYPVTTLPALEAVQAAKEQGLQASERLDRALRVAFFGRSRTISMRHEILDTARTVDGLDEERLRDAIDSGRAREAVMTQMEAARGDEIQGSPHVFLPDGSDVHNPGVELAWHGRHGEGFPVVKGDDPSIYMQIFERIAPS